MKDIIKQLSEAMNLSEADVMLHAKIMANTIKQDKSAEFFLAADEETQIMFVEAYSKAATRKIDHMCTEYLTNPNTRRNVQESAMAMLRRSPLDQLI